MQARPMFGVRPAGWTGADPHAHAARLLAWAEHADELSFDVVFVGDRLLAKAQVPGLPVYDAPMLDPFVLLSAMSARTRQVRLAPLVAVIPFRHPASLAKLTASLDVVSGGRLVLGAGAGWSDPELRMFGVDRGRRGAQMEEGLRLLHRLWAGDTVTEQGEFWTLEQVRVLPQPVQRPGPPVWMGSFSPDDAVTWDGRMTRGQTRALSRIGRVADGWVPLTYSAGHKRQLRAEQLAEGWRTIADAAVGAGRNPADIQILYAHWVAIVRTEEERRACMEGLARFFPGSYEEACETYLIGTPEEIVERIRGHTAYLEPVDGYLFTSITEAPEQLEAIAAELRPALAPGEASRR